MDISSEAKFDAKITPHGNGQAIHVPAKVRRELGVGPGDTVEVTLRKIKFVRVVEKQIEKGGRRK